MTNPSEPAETRAAPTDPVDEEAVAAAREAAAETVALADIDLDKPLAPEEASASKPRGSAPLRSRRAAAGLAGEDEFLRAKNAAAVYRKSGPLDLDAPIPEDAAPEAIAEWEARKAARLEAQWEKLEKQAEDLLRIAGNVLDPMASKMGAVKLGVDLAARQPNDREMRIKLLPKEIHTLINDLVGRIHAETVIARRLQVAIFQHGDATRTIAAVKAKLEEARVLPRAEGIPHLATLDFPKTKGKLYTMANLPLAFKGDPVLGRLFPLRQTTPMGTGHLANLDKSGTDPKLAVKSPTRPLVPPPASPPRPGTASLREAWNEMRARAARDAEERAKQTQQSASP